MQSLCRTLNGIGLQSAGRSHLCIPLEYSFVNVGVREMGHIAIRDQPLIPKHERSLLQGFPRGQDWQVVSWPMELSKDRRRDETCPSFDTSTGRT